MSDPFNPIITREKVGLGVSIGAGSIDAADVTSIENRLAALEAKVNPPQQAITGARFYGPLSTLSGYGAIEPFTLTTNILYVSALYVPQDATFDDMRVVVSTAGGSVADAIRMGIYNVATHGGPSNLRVDLGTIGIGTTTGEKIQPINVTLPRGLYWLGGFTGGTGIAIDSINAGTSTGMTAILGHFDTSGSTPRAAGYRATAIADGNLPNPFGQLTTHAPVPVFWLRAT